MNTKRNLKRLQLLVVLGLGVLLWELRGGPSVAGVWQTSEAGIIGREETRPTIILGRAGDFQFDEFGRVKARRDANIAKWELKDRAIWIIEGGKREKLADVAEVTATSMMLCLADVGVQKFIRIGDAD